jgi:hypothetical protein
MLGHEAARVLPVVVRRAVRVFLGFGFALLASCSCSKQQPGCIEENCKLLREACRVTIPGTPTAPCFNVEMPPADFDYDSYCVTACNAQRNGGALAQCIANLAETCRDAGPQLVPVVLAACVDGGSEPSCETDCFNAQRTCDDACSGGRACDTCRRQGNTECPACPDSGFKVCEDCSAQCGLTYIACTQHCP